MSLYATTVPLAEGKQVAFAGLPDIERMHIFAAAISRPQALSCSAAPARPG
ncbi:hypothetical protein GCM10010317_059490 [Streptomyces mirabilis]|uniref:hypothetical protein n=1 Tax=Streptomyces mirabilis TaxID=68239 RepID=UPI00167E5DDB|nr:hypothetical protein [Streptomyces mirabilis]GHD63261.1 hypothetical protein GCM10010317_059490 [Streptomyces mirabilis]